MISQFEKCIEHFKYLILDDLDCQCCIAGGALRAYFADEKKQSDIDLFFPNEDEFNKAKKYFDEKEHKVIIENDKVLKIMYNNRVYDLVKIYYPDPNAVIESFDFTVACCAVDKERVYHHNTFFIDLAKRRLVINKLPYPVSSLRRMQKYIIKGYKMCNGGIAEMAKALSEVKVEEINESKMYID